MFKHIFVLNPEEDYDYLRLTQFCKQISFPLSQIYILGHNKKIKKPCKKYLLPYLLTSYNTFIKNYYKLFRLKPSFFVILNRYEDLFDMDINYVTLLYITTNLYGFKTTQDYVFDYLSSKSFRNIRIKKINHYQNESLWLKN